MDGVGGERWEQGVGTGSHTHVHAQGGIGAKYLYFTVVLGHGPAHFLLVGGIRHDAGFSFRGHGLFHLHGLERGETTPHTTHHMPHNVTPHDQSCMGWFTASIATIRERQDQAAMY